MKEELQSHIEKLMTISMDMDMDFKIENDLFRLHYALAHNLRSEEKIKNEAEKIAEYMDGYAIAQGIDIIIPPFPA